MPVLVKRDPHPAGHWPEYEFYCPGCRCDHGFKTDGDHPRWAFNGNMTLPTVTPSLLTKWSDSKGDKCCHLFIQNGMIQYLGDCTHELAGRTIRMEKIE